MTRASIDVPRQPIMAIRLVRWAGIGMLAGASLAGCSQRESTPEATNPPAPSSVASASAGGSSVVASSSASSSGSSKAAASAPASGQSFKSLDLTGATYGKTLEMNDTSDKLRTLAEFRGKVVLLFFGYTTCPDVCPTTLAKAAEIRKALGDGAKDLQVIFVTLDPDRDTGPVLDSYVHAFDPGFLALRPDAMQLAKGTREFKVFYQRVPTKDGKTYTIDHTAASYVIDRQGQLRLMVKGAQSVDDVASDLRQLLQG